MTPKFKFLRRVRIHGGECGAVARALHHEVENESLPAARKKIFFAKIERKYMKSKTTFKKVALVVVATLGFSTIQTASFATWDAETITPSAKTATITNTNTTLAGRVNQQVSVAITATVAADSTTSNIDWLTLATTMTSQPSGSSVYPTLTGASAAFGTNGAFKYSSTDELLYDTQTTFSLSETGTATDIANINYATDTNVAITEFTATVGSVSFVPTAAGVYTFTVWNEKDRTASDTNENSTVPATLTWSGQPALSGTESYKTFSVIVSSGAANVAITAVGGSTFAKGRRRWCSC